MKKSLLPIAAAAVLIIAGTTLTSCEKEDVNPINYSDQNITLEQKNHMRPAPSPAEYKVNRNDVTADNNVPREKDIDRPLQTKDGYNHAPVSDSI